MTYTKEKESKKMNPTKQLQPAKRATIKQLQILSATAFEQLSKLQLENIKTEIKCKFGTSHFNFYITVFNTDYDNVTVNFYDHEKPTDCEKKLRAVLSILKTDSLETIKQQLETEQIS